MASLKEGLTKLARPRDASLGSNLPSVTTGSAKPVAKRLKAEEGAPKLTEGPNLPPVLAGPGRYAQEQNISKCKTSQMLLGRRCRTKRRPGKLHVAAAATEGGKAMHSDSMGIGYSCYVLTQA